MFINLKIYSPNDITVETARVLDSYAIFGRLFAWMENKNKVR